MSGFLDTMMHAGLRPREIVADGRWRRCATEAHPRKKNGAYLLALDGRRGWFRDWAAMDGVQVWRSGEDYRPDPSADARRRLERDRRRAERRQAISRAAAFWRAAAPFRGHPYIANKGLSALGCAGLRTWAGSIRVEGQDGWADLRDTWLVAPLFWRGRLVNVQRISSGGVKRQWPGAPQSGAFLELARPSAAITAIVEGLATGLAVFQCVRQARVVVAYYADNLLPVVRALNPAGPVVMVADNDHRTLARSGINPGVEKARNAADLIGCGVTWFDGIDGTDADDALREWGPSAARRIERQIVGAARYVVNTS